LEALSTRPAESENRIRHLEGRLQEILDRFNVPHFGDDSPARIDRQTYLPVIQGRHFDDWSSQGLTVLVNVAHALAHQRTAIDLGLPLPHILLIDGLTSNVGRKGADLERIRGVYDYLIELSDELGERLQVIVSDNDIPTRAQPYRRLILSEEDRLIPTDDISKARAALEGSEPTPDE